MEHILTYHLWFGINAEDLSDFDKESYANSDDIAEAGPVNNNIAAWTNNLGPIVVFVGASYWNSVDILDNEHNREANIFNILLRIK